MVHDLVICSDSGPALIAPLILWPLAWLQKRQKIVMQWYKYCYYAQLHTASLRNALWLSSANHYHQLTSLKTTWHCPGLGMPHFFQNRLPRQGTLSGLQVQSKAVIIISLAVGFSCARLHEYYECHDMKIYMVKWMYGWCAVPYSILTPRPYPGKTASSSHISQRPFSQSTQTYSESVSTNMLY